MERRKEGRRRGQPSVRPSVPRRAKRARRILGRDFAPPTTSFALGFVRVSFPESDQRRVLVPESDQRRVLVV